MQFAFLIIFLVLISLSSEITLETIATNIEKFFYNKLHEQRTIMYDNNNFNITIKDISFQITFDERTTKQETRQEIIYYNFTITYSYNMLIQFSNNTTTFLPSRLIQLKYTVMVLYRYDEGGFTYDGPLYAEIDHDLELLKEYKLFDEFFDKNAIKFTKEFQNLTNSVLRVILSYYPRDPLLDRFDDV